MTPVEERLAEIGLLLNPVLTIVPGCPPVQDILDDGERVVGKLIYQTPPRVRGFFTQEQMDKLHEAGLLG